MTQEDNNNFHPYYQYREKRTEEEVMVLDNITSPPVYREEFVTTWSERGTLEKQDVSVLLPHEIIRAKF